MSRQVQSLVVTALFGSTSKLENGIPYTQWERDQCPKRNEKEPSKPNKPNGNLAPLSQALRVSESAMGAATASDFDSEWFGPGYQGEKQNLVRSHCATMWAGRIDEPYSKQCVVFNARKSLITDISYFNFQLFF